MAGYFENPVELLIVGAVFGLVLAVWLGLLCLWHMKKTAQTRKVDQRLGLAKSEAGEGRVLRLWHEGKEFATTVSGEAKRQSWLARLDTLHQHAGFKTSSRTVFSGVFGLATMIAVVLILAGSPLTGLVLGGAIPVCFFMFLNYRVKQNEAKFESQLADALELAARSLRAGHPLQGAFRLIAEETIPPMRDVFREICEQQDLGVSLEEALRKAGEAYGSEDMKLFSTTVIIQMRSGGNLADMMERVSSVIRDRMRLSRRIRTLTAQTQFSKWILVALPVVMFAVLNIISPKYMTRFYTTTDGQWMLATAASSVLLGTWAMNRLARLRY